MYRRFTVLAALATGALAAVAALPLVSACQHRPADSSILAADAHAEAASPPAGGTATGQLTPVPSLAPLVRTLRPVVVNIASKYKPHRRMARRLPPGHPQLNPFGGGGDDNDQGDNNDEEDPMERFFRFFGQQPPQQDQGERQGLGSGFLIGDGLVLTNNHVVEVQDEQHPGRFRPMDEIKVFTDETAPGGAREFAAKVVGNDPKTDVALVKIEGKGVDQLKAATLGDSDALEVGDYVIAIGEPFGLQATVTSGIVSAKERSQFGGPYSDYLQTDASINPGNSGGPLFNLRGEVVGINAAIISGANTIGFAIPIAVVKQILPQLKSKGKVVRGFLGVQPQGITADMVQQLGLKNTKGALIADVVKDSPAEKAGLRPGDVIVSVNGKQVNDNNQLTRDIGAIPPGNVVKLGVIREGKEKNYDVKVAPRPDETEGGGRSERGGQNQNQGDPLGLTVQDLTPELARRAQVEPGTKGALVTDVNPDSGAADAGFEPGDVVVEVNRKPVASVEQYRAAVKSLKKGDTALVRIKRGQGSLYLPVQVR